MAPVNTVLPLILATMATLTAALPGPRFGPPHGFPGPAGGWGGPWEPIPIDDVLPTPVTSSESAILTVSATSLPMVVGTSTALTTDSSGSTSFQDASSVMVTLLTVTAPSTAAATATAIDTSNPDWDPEASHCKDDDEVCKKEKKELDEWIEEFTKTYRPSRTVDVGGYPIRATPTTMVTEFLKPQETKIAAPVGASDVENIQCLGLDCGLSA